MSDAAPHALPRLDPATHSHYIDLSLDRLHVEYSGETRNERDVGCARADAPVAWEKELFYFEATVLGTSSSAVSMAIGLTPRVFDPNRHPGWYAGSLAYHAATGTKWAGDDSKGAAYAKRWGAVGDVVGCGVLTDTREVFFTLNGMHLGTAFRGVRGPLFATVGLHRRGECMQLNFGASPFALDVPALLRRHHERRSVQLAKYAIDPLTVRALVLEYLRADGFVGTLRAMGEVDNAEEGDGPATSGMAALMRREMGERGRARRLAMGGEWDAVLALLDASAAHPCARVQHAVAMVQCQRFVELVARGAAEDAMCFARTHLAPLPRAEQHHVHRVLALLAYPDLAHAPDRALLDQRKRRAAVADTVTRCMFAHQHALLPLPRLERVFAHYQLLRRLVHEQRMPRRGQRRAHAQRDESDSDAVTDIHSLTDDGESDEWSDEEIIVL